MLPESYDLPKMSLRGWRERLSRVGVKAVAEEKTSCLLFMPSTCGISVIYRRLFLPLIMHSLWAGKIMCITVSQFGILYIINDFNALNK